MIRCVGDVAEKELHLTNLLRERGPNSPIEEVIKLFRMVDSSSEPQPKLPPPSLPTGGGGLQIPAPPKIEEAKDDERKDLPAKEEEKKEE
jgi:hypothetical protein